MNIPKFVRQLSVKRSLSSLKENYEKFKNQYGSDPKMAKCCNNVIDDLYFNIPLNQVDQRAPESEKYIFYGVDKSVSVTYKNMLKI